QVAHGTSLVRPREIPAEKIVRDSTRWPGGASRPPPTGALVQWALLWGGVHTGWEESVRPGLSRPAMAGLDCGDRRHAVGRHKAGPTGGAGRGRGSWWLGRICGAGFIPASEGGVGPQRPPTRRRPAYSRPPQGVRGAGAGPCGWEESVGPGLSRPAKAGLDRSDRRHAVGRHIAGPHRGCGARARVLVAGKNLWGRAYPGRRRWVGLRRPPTRRRPA